MKEVGKVTKRGGFEYGNGFGGWMSGYDKYLNAMKRRLEGYWKIDGTLPSSTELIKQYLHDHADGSPAGGLLTFRINADDFTKEEILGRRVIASIAEPTNIGHSMAIVGYDDPTEFSHVRNFMAEHDPAPPRPSQAGTANPPPHAPPPPGTASSGHSFQQIVIPDFDP